MSSRHLQDVFKTSSKTSLRRLCKTSSRRLGRRKIFTLKTFWRRLQDQQMFAGLSNSGMFKALVYSEPKKYSEPFQASIWCSVFLIKSDIYKILVHSGVGIFWDGGIFRTLSSIHDEVFYLEPFVTIRYLDFWYIILSRTQSIQNTMNL